MPIHAHANPRSTPPSVQSVLSSLLSPIRSSASLHMHTVTLLLHEKLPPSRSSPYWVLISLSTGESSRLSPEAPFQSPFVSRRASVNPLTLPRKSLIWSISNKYHPSVTAFSSPQPLHSQPAQSHPSVQRLNPFPGILAFLGQKILYSSQFGFFFQKNNWLLALCMNEDKVGAMAIYLGLPLWPPLHGLGQKNRLIALYCFIT